MTDGSTAWRTARWWSVAMGAALASLVVTAWLGVLGGTTLWRSVTGLEPGVPFVVSYAAVGLFIVHRLPGSRIGPLLCVAAGAAAAAVLCGAYAYYALDGRSEALPFAAVAYKATGPLYVVSYIALTVWLPLMFPDGRAPSAWLRPIGWSGGAAVVAITMAMLRLGPRPVQEVAAWSPPNHPFPTDVLWLGSAANTLETWLPWLALATLLPRYLRADQVTRVQLRWFVIAAATIGLTVYEGSRPLPDWLATLQQVPWIPISIAIAVVRHRLWNLDVAVRRSIVYGGMLAGIVVLYAGVVGGASVFLDVRGIGPSLLAAAVVAVLVEPGRTRLERAAERLVYGGRRDPHSALATVGQRLQSVESTEVLPALCQAVVDAARVPWAGIEPLVGPAASTTPGIASSRTAAIELLHAGVCVGTLIVGLAPGDAALGRGEQAVVDALAPILAAAVHASSLTVEVQRSRERLVTAREDERRRLRRDLHDGLGPVLAGITMEIQAARTLLDVDAIRAREMLGAAERWAREAVGEVRRVVYGLRPPVLDQLGLVRAMEEHVASLDQHGSRLSVEIHTRGELGGLPAGAEVAAYLIALEALTNVVRHARAAHCSISLSSTAETVELEIIDDGNGFEEHTPFGVGLSSMRERAEELGGVVVVGRGAERGTRVMARIPVSPT